MESKQKNTTKVIAAQDRASLFLKEYQELCDKHGFAIQVIPQWKARDDGTFSLVQITSLAPLPAK